MSFGYKLKLHEISIKPIKFRKQKSILDRFFQISKDHKFATNASIKEYVFLSKGSFIILCSAIHLPKKSNIKCSNVYRYRFYKGKKCAYRLLQGNYYAIYHYSKYGTRKLNKSSKKIRPFIIIVMILQK